MCFWSWLCCCGLYLCDGVCLNTPCIVQGIGTSIRYCEWMLYSMGAFILMALRPLSHFGRVKRPQRGEKSECNVKEPQSKGESGQMGEYVYTHTNNWTVLAWCIYPYMQSMCACVSILYFYTHNTQERERERVCVCVRVCMYQWSMYCHKFHVNKLHFRNATGSTK